MLYPCLYAHTPPAVLPTATSLVSYSPIIWPLTANRPAILGLEAGGSCVALSILCPSIWLLSPRHPWHGYAVSVMLVNYYTASCSTFGSEMALDTNFDMEFYGFERVDPYTNTRVRVVYTNVLSGLL